MPSSKKPKEEINPNRSSAAQKRHERARIAAQEELQRQFIENKMKMEADHPFYLDAKNHNLTDHAFIPEPPKPRPVIEVTIQFPPWFEDFTGDQRYHIAYGGRGSGKTYSFALYFILECIKRKLRILCTREFQSSIGQSVYATFVEIIEKYNMTNDFIITNATIVAKTTGSEIMFAGLKNNIDSLKSYRDINICWVEEAQSVSYNSWKKLLPTIREPGSQVWISFNPELDDDDVYKRFVLTPWELEDAVIKFVNYWDNPWFSTTALVKDMERDKKYNPEEYNNVWCGQCVSSKEGFIYLEQVVKAKNEGRIRSVAIDRSVPIHTFWDIGFRDKTAIWFAQIVKGEYRIVDFIDGSGLMVTDWAVKLQEKNYYYGVHHLPHDADHKDFNTGMSTMEIMRRLGWNVKITPKMSIQDGINAGREMLTKCIIDENRCEDGILALKKYHYNVVQRKNNTISKVPEHDEWSHASDAWRYLGLMLKESAPRKVLDMEKFKVAEVIMVLQHGHDAWMAR
jgi:phage terminase large subunit